MGDANTAVRGLLVWFVGFSISFRFFWMNDNISCFSASALIAFRWVSSSERADVLCFSFFFDSLFASEFGFLVSMNSFFFNSEAILESGEGITSSFGFSTLPIFVSAWAFP